MIRVLNALPCFASAALFGIQTTKPVTPVYAGACFIVE